MRVLKLFIISAVVLFGLLTCFSLLLPSHVRISRAIDISDLSPHVKRQIEDLRNWESWNEYIRATNLIDVSNDRIYTKNLSILRMSLDDDGIHTRWRQPSGKAFHGVFRLIDHDSSTTVQWYFDFVFKWYPWEKFSSIVYDQQLGPQMEKSLHNLKDLLEKEH
jgi:hypothetical protein